LKKGWQGKVLWFFVFCGALIHGCLGLLGFIFFSYGLSRNGHHLSSLLPISFFLHRVFFQGSLAICLGFLGGLFIKSWLGVLNEA